MPSYYRRHFKIHRNKKTSLLLQNLEHLELDVKCLQQLVDQNHWYLSREWAKIIVWNEQYIINHITQTTS